MTSKSLLLSLFAIVWPAVAFGQTPCTPPKDPASKFVANTTIVPGETVYVGGTGRRVVVFHELPGLTEHDLALGARLICEGFQVYMPLMFGKIGDSSNGQREACKAPKGSTPLFWCTRGWGEHPILERWVRNAVKTIGSDGAPIAIVGMCLTGTFALSLARDANVMVAVVAQPTLPTFPLAFWLQGALDLPQDTLESALKTLADRKAGVFLVRARFDFISDPDKFAHISYAVHGMHASGLTDVHVEQALSAKHSALTHAAYDAQNHIITELLAMLRLKLK